MTKTEKLHIIRDCVLLVAFMTCFIAFIVNQPKIYRFCDRIAQTETSQNIVKFIFRQ